MAEPNGRRVTTFVISILSAASGAGITLIAVGLWVGTARANLDAHISNEEIHMTESLREAVARDIVDREIQPTLKLMQKQLDRIEAKVDARQ